MHRPARCRYCGASLTIKEEEDGLNICHGCYIQIKGAPRPEDTFRGPAIKLKIYDEIAGWSKDEK